MELTITQPDDWHLHLRDGDLLHAVVPHRSYILPAIFCFFPWFAVLWFLSIICGYVRMCLFTILFLVVIGHCCLLCMNSSVCVDAFAGHDG